MKTYDITAFGQRTTVRLETLMYGPAPHCEKPLAIRVIEILPDGEEKTFGNLTVNLDPWTHRQDQSETRAFAKTYEENEGWAQQIIDALVATGAAKKTDITLTNDRGISFPLYEFDKEKM